MAASERASGARSIAGVVYGSGFEDRPSLLAALAERWRVFGNPAEVVARLKDPLAFAWACEANEIPHPETTLEQPGELPSWLARQRGGSGGGHIRAVGDEPAADAQTYFQRRVDGRPVSALVLGASARSAVLGFSEQWSMFQNSRPFRFAGAARPAALPRSVEQRLTAGIDRFCAAIPLVGLNSFDFLLSDHGFWLLEVNPRPGATLDIFDTNTSGAETLFAAHIAACEGVLAPAPRGEGASAMQIVYAERDIASTPRMAWPDWARDRQAEGSHVGEGDPFCSVVANGATIGEARTRVSERIAMIQQSINM